MSNKDFTGWLPVDNRPFISSASYSLLSYSLEVHGKATRHCPLIEIVYERCKSENRELSPISEFQKYDSYTKKLFFKNPVGPIVIQILSTFRMQKFTCQQTVHCYERNCARFCIHESFEFVVLIMLGVFCPQIRG